MPGDDGPPAQSGYALPYFTRLGGDTEYLISNPGPASITGKLVVYGPQCRPVGEPVGIHVAPHCTQSVRIAAIVPNNAGHSILTFDHPPAVSILYSRARDQAVVGHALAGSDALTGWTPGIKSKTYAFGYRTQPLGPDTLSASLFVSNPNSTNLGGLFTVFDDLCQSHGTSKFSIKPGCTREFKLPPGHYGFGQIRVLAPAVLSVLHFAQSAGGLATAELLGEANRINEPPPPGAGLLIDYTHGCRGAATGDMGQWEAAVAAAGITVTKQVLPPITLAALLPHRAFAVITPRTAYASSEVQAIYDFVSGGGGLIVVQDYGVDPALGGPMPWSWPTRSVLGAFGIVDDNNMAQDTLHHDGASTGRVLFEAAQGCFASHPITSGLGTMLVDAVCTFSSAAGWTTIVQTDGDAVPPKQPVLVERAVGSGRVVVVGDPNSWTNAELGKFDNKAIGVRCAERALFKI